MKYLKYLFLLILISLISSCSDVDFETKLHPNIFFNLKYEIITDQNKIIEEHHLNNGSLKDGETVMIKVYIYAYEHEKASSPISNIELFFKNPDNYISISGGGFMNPPFESNNSDHAIRTIIMYGGYADAINYLNSVDFVLKWKEDENSKSIILKPDTD
ncbi:hypothetical protein [Paenibacillus marinisediminis]